MSPFPNRKHRPHTLHPAFNTPLNPLQKLHQTPPPHIRTHKKPRSLPTRTTRSIKLKDTGVPEPPPHLHLPDTQLPRGRRRKHLDRHGPPAPHPGIHMRKKNINLPLPIDLIPRDHPRRKRRHSNARTAWGN
ncbi:hypothetical protein H2248_011882 [Termitomyces sp. 'cryptogamus']|nr:hypothetical protein H2248_011882 [Termitomyces sp. 'cryptogamus']